MTTLAAPTLFPIGPDSRASITDSRSFLTDVQRTRSGKEIRQAWRSVPVRRITFTLSTVDGDELSQFISLWLLATEALRYLVPLWPEVTQPTAFPDAHTITCDTTNRDFVAGAQALLSLSDTVSELVTIDTVAADHITTVGAIVGAWGSYPVGSVALAPVMTGWLTPPTRTQRTPYIEEIALTFDEELPSVAGMDSSIGAAATPAGYSITLSSDDFETQWIGKKYHTLTARVYDESGQQIREPNITWTITPLGSLHVGDPGVVVTFPQNKQQVHFAFVASIFDYFTVTATYGAVSASKNI